MSPPTTSVAAVCGGCRSPKRWVIHCVRIRGTVHRLCTSCLLLAHPLCFCPSCFQVYDGSAAANSNAPPPPAKRITCAKCSSMTHSRCVSHHPPSSSYLCPPCADPKFSFFDVDLNPDSCTSRALDNNLAVVLLCAARIASASMSRAAFAAREEAVKKASEASMARKRAREALDCLARVVGTEKARRKEASSLPTNNNAGTKDKLPDRNSGSAVQLEDSGDVSANLSSPVGLSSQGEGFDKFLAENASPSSLNNVAPKVVEGKEKKTTIPGSGVNGVTGNLNEMERFSNVGNVDNDSGQKLPLHSSNGKGDKSAI